MNMRCRKRKECKSTALFTYSSLPPFLPPSLPTCQDGCLSMDPSCCTQESWLRSDDHRRRRT